MSEQVVLSTEYLGEGKWKGQAVAAMDGSTTLICEIQPLESRQAAKQAVANKFSMMVIAGAYCVD